MSCKESESMDIAIRLYKLWCIENYYIDTVKDSLVEEWEENWVNKLSFYTKIYPNSIKYISNIEEDGWVWTNSFLTDDMIECKKWLFYDIQVNFSKL